MLHVDDVDALYEEFVRRGALIKQAPADKPHGMREFSVTTPDGHRLMIGQDLIEGGKLTRTSKQRETGWSPKLQE
ncbi:VOC family protein [Variovorax paradoxus]|uniref:VOC family protein n=1 Tax=Variovorax paradoxus TaxID=34073 RepID=UPI000A83FC03|nr:VOC family protein [Variovorax paradoxus]